MDVQSVVVTNNGDVCGLDVAARMPGFTGWVGHGPVDARSLGIVAPARHDMVMCDESQCCELQQCSICDKIKGETLITYQENVELLLLPSA